MTDSRYSFKPPSKEIMQKYKHLTSKAVLVDTPFGKMTPAAFQNYEEKLQYGPYIGHDDIMGKIVYWHLPSFDEKGCDNLAYAITHLHQYQELRSTYKSLIENDLLFRWQLIFVLLCEDHIKDQLPPLKKLPKWSTPELLKNTVLFQSLVEDGAQYKHYLAGAYNEIDESLVPHLKNIFGNDAFVPLSDDIDYLTDLVLQEKNSLVKVLLENGANINNRTDSMYGNTLLHYLVALEDSAKAIEIIDMMSTYQQTKSNTVVDLDYTIQDKQGKTVLFLAVALGLEFIVKRLLKVARENKKDVGINIPDQEGRTPLMLATALGYASMRDALIVHGANLQATDKQKNDMLWYAKASLDDIKQIMRFASLNPERGAYCIFHSYIYSDAAEGIPLVLIDQENKPHLLLRSAQKEHMDMIHIALLTATPKLQSIIFPQVVPLLESSGPYYNVSIAEYRKENQLKNNVGFITQLEKAKKPNVAASITLGILTTPERANESQQTTPVVKGACTLNRIN